MSWSDEDRPKVCDEWFIEELDSGNLLAKSENTVRILRGANIASLLPRLDGTRSVEQLVVGIGIPRESLVNMLDLLESYKLIDRFGGIALPLRDSAYWNLTGANPRTVSRNTDDLTCAIETIGTEYPAILHEAFEAAGIRISNESRFRVVVVRDVFDPNLAKINENCLQKQSGWMLVRPFGTRQWIGPMFVPGTTPCWSCMTWWLYNNGWTTESVVAQWDLHSRATLTLAATQVARWLLTGQSQPTKGRIVEFDASNLSFVSHCLLPSPTCAHCQGLAVKPLDLSSTVSHLTGIVCQFQRVQAWPDFAIYTAKTSLIRCSDDRGLMSYCYHQDVFGTGESESDAERACLMEGIERYSTRFFGYESIISKQKKDLGIEAVAEEAAAPSLTHETNESEIIAWTEGTSLITGDRRYVRASSVYLTYDHLHDADTNGCAAGLTFEYATMSALLELIERDAFAMWWYSRASRPQIATSALESPRVNALMNNLRKHDVVVTVIDVTTDFETPVSVAIAHLSDRMGLAIGAAAHPDPEQCVWKALAEMSTGIPRLLAGDNDRRHWLDDRSIEEIPGSSKSLSAREWRKGKTTSSPAEVLQHLLGVATRLGIDVIRVDLTRSEIGIPVVRLLAPGLCHISSTMTPRLALCPLKLGWTRRALNWEEMNPKRPFL